MTSPMVRGRSVRRDRATMLGRYPSDSAAERTLARASSMIADCPVSARETVVTDSHADVATSLMLTSLATTTFVLRRCLCGRDRRAMARTSWKRLHDGKRLHHVWATHKFTEWDIWVRGRAVQAGERAAQREIRAP